MYQLITFLFFRFLNFFLVVSLIIYVITKYLISYIKVKIALENKEKKELLEKQLSLEEYNKEVERQIAHEKIMYEQVQNKITAWRAIVEEQRREDFSKKEIIHNKTCIIGKQQRANLVDYLHYMSAAKEVVLLFEKKIKHDFNKEMVIDQFTHYAINQLYNKNNL